MHTGTNPGEGPGGPASPLFLDQNEARRAEKKRPRIDLQKQKDVQILAHAHARKQNAASLFTGEKCLRMRRDINHVVDIRQSHWLRGKIPAKCCQDERRNGSFFCQW